ncbi:MAG TPA: hypothetical protein ENN86_01345 [Desulfobacteraceae bacterium]|nr:hypothetical protein [Desulfobacteraceae bacterium]
MIEHTYQVLGYYDLLDILSRYASCELGKSNCLSLRPSKNIHAVNNELRLVAEMKLLLKVKGFLSFADITDIDPALGKAEARGSCLEVIDFSNILRLAKTCGELKRFISSNRELCPGVYELAADIPNFEVLSEKIGGAITPYGEIKDSASPTLKKIREKKISLRSDIQKRLESIQKTKSISRDSQDFITVRDGRYIIALRTDQYSKINGIVHGYSQTRATCYLEPVEVLQDNNRITELLQEEREEEHRILVTLTGNVRDSAENLKYAQSLLSRLDGLYARGKFSENLSCIMPETGDRCGVDMKGARNAILMALSLDKRMHGLKAELPVPVDILINNEQNILIISGPNRGGKTVALKTLGLLSLMTQSGIHIPAEEGSCLPVFNRIIADIGDDQNIKAGLSTFSAHLEHLNYIIENADRNSLFIIDEPGIGTDPDEGVALAMSVLDFLSAKGAFVAVSTHFNRLKNYGLSNQQVVNAAVEFNDSCNCPTFKLKYGLPGVSHALEIAEEIGMRSDVIERANGYLDQDEIHVNRLIDKMNRLTDEAEQTKIEAENEKLNYQSAEKKLRDRITALEEEKRALIEEKRMEADEVINRAKDELKKAINLLKKDRRSVQASVSGRVAEVSTKLTDHFIRESNENSQAETEDLENGQMVYHTKIDQRGIIQSIDHSGERALVMFGNVKIMAQIKDLKPVEAAANSDYDRTGGLISWNLKGCHAKELNVIGCRVDEALAIIDKSINRAIVEGELTIKIVHGFGTGRLRNAIRDHLRNVPFIKNMSSADPKFGGEAITVIELT